MHRTPPPKPSAGGQSDGFLNRRSQVQDLPRALPSPTDTQDPHPGQAIESTYRSVVCAGLWPLLDDLVRGGLPCYSSAEVRALALLGLVEQVRTHLLATQSAEEVLHQLAAHRLARPAVVAPAAARAWLEILLAGDEPSARGRMLLGWLRLGTMTEPCFAIGCLGTVAGVARLDDRVELACVFHRTAPKHWGALDRHLAGIGGAR